MTNLGKLVAAFVKLRPLLETSAQARTGSRATAEDLIQDTWLKLQHVERDRAIDNPGGYITRIATHTVSDHVRKERRRAEIDAELSGLLWESADDLSPERALIGRENLKAVHAVLAGMPAKTRRIFLMNRVEGVPHRRIAELLGVTDEAVYYHIRRALERLAQLRDEIAD